MFNENKKAYIEIDLSGRSIMPVEKVLRNTEKYHIGVELSDGNRLYVSTVYGNEGVELYILNDPAKLTQYGSQAFISYEEMFKECKANLKSKPVDWYVFTSTNYLISWAMGDDLNYGDVIVFNNDTISPEEVKEKEQIVFKIDGFPFMFSRTGTSDLLLINGSNNVIQGEFGKDIHRALLEVKHTYGNVEAYVCADVSMLYSFIAHENVGGYLT